MGRKKEVKPFDGQRLAETLESQGMSYAKLGKMLGFTRQTVSNWIKRNEIDHENLINIANLLKVSPRYLEGQCDDKDEVILEENGDFVLMNDFRAFDLMGKKGFSEYVDSRINQAKSDGRIILTEKAKAERLKIEKDVAIKKLRQLVQLSYFTEYGIHVHNDEKLSELLKIIRAFLQDD